MAPGGPGPRDASDAPVRALAVYAHPDDPDVACGGTISRWVAAGARVEVCICCEGDKGSRDPAVRSAQLVALRREEAQRAAIALGVARQHWLGYADGEIEDTAELRHRLVSLVREVRPDTVLAPDPTAVFFGHQYVNHRDHRAVGWAVLDAVAPAAASPRYFPDAGLAHQVSQLYLSGTLEPDRWVDIGPWLDAKVAAVGCHVSQVGEGPAWLHDAVADQAREDGVPAGLAYAEAFRWVLLG